MNRVVRTTSTRTIPTMRATEFFLFFHVWVLNEAIIRMEINERVTKNVPSKTRSLDQSWRV